MEQNRLDLDQFRQEWNAADERIADIGWASTEEISHLVARYRVQQRRRRTSVIAMSACLLVGVTILFQWLQPQPASATRCLTNQAGMNNSAVEAIMDEAWGEINKNIASL